MKKEELLDSAINSAKTKISGSNAVFLPDFFRDYLEKNTFSDFYHVSQTCDANSRHAVAHGVASQESYTMARALQAILILDQLAFFT